MFLIFLDNHMSSNVMLCVISASKIGIRKFLFGHFNSEMNQIWVGCITFWLPIGLSIDEYLPS
jgi:hypothetical protein